MQMGGDMEDDIHLNICLEGIYFLWNQRFPISNVISKKKW